MKETRQQAQEGERGRRKELIGVVVSNKMEKTAVVSVERRIRHPLYRKIIRRTKKYKAHDSQNTANLGDIVRIVETRPMSKEKRWRIAAVLTRGNVAEIRPAEIGETEVAEVAATPVRPQEEAPVESQAPEARAAGEAQEQAASAAAPTAEESEEQEPSAEVVATEEAKEE